MVMLRKTAIALLTLCALAAPALADSYPVSGAWGQSASSKKGTIDCTGKRVITFNGNQRTDSKGGVPAYRNKSVTAVSPGYRVVDVFTNGQVNNAQVVYTLQLVDDDHIVMSGQTGTLKLQRCE
jgi:hypothetical protein